MRKVLPIFTVVGLILGSLATAGVAPNGQEFQVNSYTTDSQFNTSIAVSGSGDFVVVWDSRYQDGSYHGVFGQMFDGTGTPVAAEFQVNTYTTSFQYLPAVAMSASGEFVVAWSSPLQDGSSVGIFGQMFDSAGARVAEEFQVNTYTTNVQNRPAVAMSASGAFVVAWRSAGQDGSYNGVFGQLFDSEGTPVGAEFQVNTHTTYDQDDPSVAMNGSGAFVVAWSSGAQDGSYDGVFGQVFDSAGTPVAAEFQVNTYSTSDQYGPSVAMSGSGAFVVAWTSYAQDGSSAGVFGRMFDSVGTPVAAEFQVNAYTTSSQYAPSVAMAGSGEFVVTWTSYAQDGSTYGVFGRMFNSAGTPVAAEFQVNTYTTSNQDYSSVAMSDSGEFVVAWESHEQDGSDFGVFAQRVVTNGPSLTNPAPAGTVDCSDPALSRPTITWEMGDYDKFKVFMGSSGGFEKGTQVSSGDKKIVTGSWSPNKKKWKSACKKAITQAADPNNPVMFVAVEGQDTDLPKSDPLRKLLSFPVRTAVQP